MLAALASAVGVVALFGAAPASATYRSCTPPAIYGTVSPSLHEQDIGCDHARDRAHQVFNHSRTDGYTCHATFSGRHTSWRCHANADSTHAFTYSFYAS